MTIKYSSSITLIALWSVVKEVPSTRRPWYISNWVRYCWRQGRDGIWSELLPCFRNSLSLQVSM